MEGAALGGKPVIDIIAMAMVMFGDLIVIITLVCAIGTLAFNIAYKVISVQRPYPFRLLAGGWFPGIVSLVGLMAIYLSETVNEEMG
jgi:hypothetical protein